MVECLSEGTADERVGAYLRLVDPQAYRSLLAEADANLAVESTATSTAVGSAARAAAEAIPATVEVDGQLEGEETELHPPPSPDWKRKSARQGPRRKLHVGHFPDPDVNDALVVPTTPTDQEPKTFVKVVSVMGDELTSFDAAARWTIQEMKNVIEAKTGLLRTTQHLVCGTKVLGPNERRLQDFPEVGEGNDDGPLLLTLVKVIPHKFVSVECRICVDCSNCTGYGDSCVSSGSGSGNPKPGGGESCGCGSGDSGCAHCRRCRSCAEKIACG